MCLCVVEVRYLKGILTIILHYRYTFWFIVFNLQPPAEEDDDEQDDKDLYEEGEEEDDEEEAEDDDDEDFGGMNQFLCDGRINLMMGRD